MGGRAHGAQTEPDARLEAFYNHTLPLCLILSLRTSYEGQSTLKDRKKDWDSALGGRKTKDLPGIFLKQIEVYLSGHLGSQSWGAVLH